MVIEYANNVLRLMCAYFPSGQAWGLPGRLPVALTRGTEGGEAGPVEGADLDAEVPQFNRSCL